MSNKNKDMCVIGTGRFGEAVINELINQKRYVFAIDKDENALTKIDKVVNKTAIADATNIEALKNLSVSRFDTVIIAVSENIEIAAALVELKIRHIIAKAKSIRHARVLRQIGIDVIVKPEAEAGVRTALIACNPIFAKFGPKILQEVGDGFVIGSTIVNNLKYTNKPIKDLNFNKFRTSIVSIKRNAKVFLPTGDFILKENDLITIIGKTADVSKTFSKITDFEKIKKNNNIEF